MWMSPVFAHVYIEGYYWTPVVEDKGNNKHGKTGEM